MGRPGKCVFLPTGHALGVLIERAMLRCFAVHLAFRHPLSTSNFDLDSPLLI